MAEGRLRVVGVPPSGPGLRRALAKLVEREAVVTALDDTKLYALQRLVPSEREAEFAPIGDLVGRFLTMMGEPIARLCPRGQLRATVDLTCRDLPSDSPLAASSRFRGTADLIVERLGEFRDWQITSNQLAAAAHDAQPQLAEKLLTLASIEDSVRAVLDETNRQFAADRVTRCLELTQDRTVPIKQVVAAVGRTEKPLYEAWLRWLTGFGIEVVVLVDHIAGSSVFGSSQRVADRFGAPIEPSEPGSWCKALFSEDAAKDPPTITIMDCADPLSESEWAVRTCLAAVESGVMPHKIGVFARGSEQYAPLLQSAGDRLGLPISSNLTVPLLTNGFASVVLRSLEALAGDDVRSLARLAHSSYLRTGLTRDNELLQAARTAYTSGPEQWSHLAAWARSQGEELEWLRTMLVWREAAMGSRANLSGWLLRLRELVGASQMSDASVGRSDTRDRDVRAQTVLQRSISDLAYIYDRSQRPELSLATFAQLARETWEDAMMVVDGKPNGVGVVSNTAALTEYDLLVVVGMLEGTLPRRRSEDPLLFDDDRAMLSRLLGLTSPLPDSRSDSVAERDEFVRICSAASSGLVFSYPQTDDNRDNVPAFYLEETKRACPHIDVHKPRSQFVPPAGEARTASDVTLRAALDGHRKPLEPPLLTTDRARAAVRPVFEAGVAPEELARALVCPFQSSSRFRLRIVAPARRRLMRSLRDLPAQADLVTSTDRETARAAFTRAIDTYLEEVYTEFEPWEIAMLRAAARRMADEWVDREFRARDLWQEEGETTYTDVSLDEHGLKNELKVGERRLKLRGKATSLKQRQGYSVLSFFDSSTPSLAESTDVNEDNEDAFLYGLYLMSQLHLAPRNPTVEVDGMDGKRVLAGFGSVRSSLPHDPKSGLEVVRVSDSRDVYFQNVMARLRQAVAVLDQADMRAVPGKHCEPCPYGELCRVSSVFGEVDSPFSEDLE